MTGRSTGSTDRHHGRRGRHTLPRPASIQGQCEGGERGSEQGNSAEAGLSEREEEEEEKERGGGGERRRYHIEGGRLGEEKWSISYVFLK